MDGKDIQYKDALKILRSNGWELVRSKGSHKIFKKENEPMSVVITKGKPLSQKTWQRECRKVGIKYE